METNKLIAMYRFNDLKNMNHRGRSSTLVEFSYNDRANSEMEYYVMIKNAAVCTRDLSLPEVIFRGEPSLSLVCLVSWCQALD